MPFTPVEMRERHTTEEELVDNPRVMVERVVGSAVRRYGLWAPHALLVVAVSGGADSLCLAGTLAALRAQGAPEAPGEIIVAHLNHGLRGDEGREDAAWVEAFAREHGLRFIGATVNVAVLARRERRSLEDAARRARYGFLRRVAAEAGAARICVGHTRDDQAETVLLHFLRGAGLAGLAGMAPRAGDIARPLLDLTRAETLAYCEARGWRPREDSSNADSRFARNRVRYELLPILERYNSNLRETLARNAALIGEDDGYLDALTAALESDSHVQRAQDTIRLPLDWLRAQPLALRRRLLLRASSELGGEDASLAARHIGQLDTLLDSQRTGKSLNLPGRLRAILDYDALTLTRAPVQKENDVAGHEYALPAPGCVEAQELGWRVRAWIVEGSPGLESTALPDLPALGRVGTPADLERAEARVYLDADAAGTDLLVRAWRPGDRFRPLGMAQEKKLQDFFADVKIPRALRGRIPLIFNERHLLWIGGQRIDDRARLTPTTRRVLALQIELLTSPASSSSDLSPSSLLGSARHPARKGTRRHGHLGEPA